MRRDDDRDPFDDLFREIERMMNDMMGDVDGELQVADGGDTADIHCDVYEESDAIRVVADLPGVRKDAIDLKCDGKVLTIAAATDTREFADRVRLPVRVDEHSASATFNNGILEVAFDRAGDSASIDLS